MATQAYEYKAKSVDEAIEEGLQSLNVTREQVTIEVINKGSRGLFGIGSEPAVVRIQLQEATPITDKPDETVPTAQTDMQATSKDSPTTAADAMVEETTATTVTSPTTEDPIAPVESAVVDEFDNDEAENFEAEDVEAEDIDDDGSEDYLQEDDEADFDEDDDLAALAADLLDEMIHLMGFEAQITAAWQDEDDDFEDEEEESSGGQRQYLLLDVEGTDLGALIGRRGETLDNIQYLLRLMVNQKIHQWKNIVVDVEGYKARRVTQVTQLAERMAEQVARTGKAISLEPMPANERRVVHMVLRNHPEVYTESYGEGSRRKVHIFASE